MFEKTSSLEDGKIVVKERWTCTKCDAKGDYSDGSVIRHLHKTSERWNRNIFLQKSDQDAIEYAKKFPK